MYKFFLHSIYFILILTTIDCNGQFDKTLYKKIDKKSLQNIRPSSHKYDSIVKKHFAKAVQLEKYLPSNFSKTGNVDYTSYIQKGLDENTNVIFPNFPIYINKNGLKIHSHSKLLFQKKSKLVLEPNYSVGYKIVNIDEAENVNIFFPKIEGDKHKHLDSKGQWGMGISITHSENVMIYYPEITKCWGDGIYIGNSKGKPSKNVKILNAFLDDNRRNGISITAGNSIFIENSFISNTIGIVEYGIDIEPNTNEDEIQNIFIKNLTTYNSGQGGLLIALDRLNGEKRKNINITLQNHTNYFSPFGVNIYVDRGFVQQKDNYLEGDIRLENLKYDQTTLQYIKLNKGKENLLNLNVRNVFNNHKKVPINQQFIDNTLKKGESFNLK